MTEPTGPAGAPPPPPPPPPAAPPPPPPPAPAAPKAPPAPGSASTLPPIGGPDSLLLGGAILLLVIGDLLLSALVDGRGTSLAGVMAGEVLLFTWLRSRAGKDVVGLSTAVLTAVIGAFVVGIVILEIGDLINSIRNLGPFTDQGVVGMLSQLSHWVGAAAMFLGLVSTWSTPAKT